ncbi:MAG TPA: 2-amino-4-hydroxy-6-hydroxymethyldihydropteridine diphosphokinase [Gammaproteobacteria bacterium]|nr:2-amino-4-hydroxy-6-hydroxymethyldihydropteridine diphosphokinase [Gammaproteobacteria bacterium]
MNDAVVVMSARVTAYVGLGSNLADPPRQVRAALDELGGLPDTTLRAASALYENPPLGPLDQPDFVNAVARLETGLEPEALLARLRAIERAHGRIRGGDRWGPRTLDLDLLLYGDRLIDTPDLVVPHPGLHERPFVLYPLAEIAPDLVIPGRGPLSELLRACPRGTLRRLGDVP